MTMQYRWHYAAVVGLSIFLFVFFVDVFPLRQQYHKLQADLAHLQERKLIAKTNTKVEKKTPAGLREELISIMHDAHVSLLAMGFDEGKLRMKIEGRRENSSQLLSYFFDQSERMDVEDLTIESSSQNRVLLNVNLHVNGLSAYHFDENEMPLPVCYQGDHRVSSNSQPFLIGFAEMVGFYENDSNMFAILNWPNGVVKVLHVGDVIGVEKAQIVSISRSGVMLLAGADLVYIQNKK